MRTSNLLCVAGPIISMMALLACSKGKEGSASQVASVSSDSTGKYSLCFVLPLNGKDSAVITLVDGKTGQVGSGIEVKIFGTLIGSPANGAIRVTVGEGSTLSGKTGNMWGQELENCSPYNSYPQSVPKSAVESETPSDDAIEDQSF